MLCDTLEGKELESLEKLEKENADLKDEKKELLRDTVIYDNHLTYAKMLLGKFMKFYERTARECYSKEFQQLLADTEQFLNGVEK